MLASRLIGSSFQRARTSSAKYRPRPTQIPSIDLSAILESYGFSAVPPSFWHPYFGLHPGGMWPLFTKPTSVAGTAFAGPPSFWHPYFGRHPGRMWPLFTKPASVAGMTIA
jgi:hypothetical protein